MSAVAAPKPNLTRPSDAMHRVASVTGMSADLDLTAISGLPRHAAQLLTLIGGAATADVVMTPEKSSGGANITISVPANTVVLVQHPIKALIKSGSGAVQVVAEWWNPGNDWNV
jgi:hypothetical protein